MREVRIQMENVVGQVAHDDLRNFFNNMFMLLPEFKKKYRKYIKYQHGAVRKSRVAKDGILAFVEFWTEEITSTALEMNLVNFQGGDLRISRPVGISSYARLPDPLSIKPLKKKQLLPKYNVVQRGHWGSNQKRRARQLYFGNLVPGQMDLTAMAEFVSPACEMLPQYNKSVGPPVLDIFFHQGGKFCFIEFQSEELCSAALDVFNHMELFGQQLIVSRSNQGNPND